MSSCRVRAALRRSVPFLLGLLVTACSGSDCPFDPLDPGCQPLGEGVAPPQAMVFQRLSASAFFDLYTANSDGTEVQRLTTTGRNGLPRWSPDGTRIAFTSWRSGRGEIWIMNADGTDQRRVVALEHGAYMPDWSPDGRHIVFSSYRSRGPGFAARAELMVMSANGTGARPLTAPLQVDDFSPSWSRSTGRSISCVFGMSTASARTAPTSGD